MADTEFKVFPDTTALMNDSAERVVKAAESKFSDVNNVFSLVLSGGSTPKALYELLGGEPYRSRLNWSKVSVYFSDERCVSPDHADSNYLMAYNAMLGTLPIPEPNIHRMRGELHPEQAAAEYEGRLRSVFNAAGPDLVLLGMGEDGHTASLYPNTAALTETDRWCVPNFVPQVDAWRITMTYPFLNRASEAIVLVSGSDKKQTLMEVLQEPRDAVRLPIQGIRPRGQLTWLLDVAAAGGVARETSR